MNATDFARAIRVYRAENDLTQQELARRVKTSQTALSMAENGRPQQLRESARKRLEKLVNISLEGVA